MSDVTFQLPGGRETDFTEDEAREVEQELRALRTDDSRAVAEAVTTALSGRGSRIVKLDAGSELAALLRALDHLRNAEQPAWEADEPPGRNQSRIELRDRLIVSLGVQPLTYEVTTWEHGARTFFSYSGAYGVGDRLVRSPDETPWRVRSATQPETPADSGRLECDAWRDE